MFLSDGKVVFSPFIIPFKFSRFTFCSCVSVCSGLIGCAVFGCVAFSFSKVGGSILLGCFCLLILMYLVLYYYLVHYLFSGVFLVFQGQKINLSLLLFSLGRQVLGLLSKKSYCLARSLSFFSYILLV